MKWIILIIPILIYFLFVSVSAAYVTDRYFFPIYAVSLSVFLSIIILFCKKISTEKNLYIILCLIYSLLIVNGWNGADWKFLYKDTAVLLDTAKEYSDKNCIYVYDAPWKALPSYIELKNYKSLTFLSYNKSAEIVKYSDVVQDGFMLVVQGNAENIINQIKKVYPHLNQNKKIGGFSYATTYFIYPGEENRKSMIWTYDKSRILGAEGSENGSNVLAVKKNQSVWITKAAGGDKVLIEIDGKVLDVEKGVFADGTNIQLFSLNGTGAQQWKIVNNDDGTSSFLTDDGKYALTCKEDGNIAITLYQQGEKTQCWWIN